MCVQKLDLATLWVTNDRTKYDWNSFIIPASSHPFCSALSIISDVRVLDSLTQRGSPDALCVGAGAHDKLGLGGWNRPGPSHSSDIRAASCPSMTTTLPGGRSRSAGDMVWPGGVTTAGLCIGGRHCVRFDWRIASADGIYGVLKKMDGNRPVDDALWMIFMIIHFEVQISNWIFSFFLLSIFSQTHSF